MEECEEKNDGHGTKYSEEGAGGNTGEPQHEQRRRLETQAALDNLSERIARAREVWSAPPPTAAVPEIMSCNPPLVRPPGDAAQLLEHQLASSAALIAYLTDYISGPTTHADVCLSFMDRMSSMLGATAQIAKVVGRLRGQVSESRQTITVEKRQTGAGGEGVLES